MTTQVPPDALSTQEENDLICEKMLGWMHECRESEPGWVEEYFWRLPDRTTESAAPSFTTWAEAGLILDELQQRPDSDSIHWCGELGSLLEVRALGPSVIRAVALRYVRSLP